MKINLSDVTVVACLLFFLTRLGRREVVVATTGDFFFTRVESFDKIQIAFVGIQLIIIRREFIIIIIIYCNHFISFIQT